MPLLQEIKVPLLSVNDTSLTIVDILVSNGSLVKEGDVIMIFETSKTTYELIAETGGFIKILAEINNDYEVNTVIAEIYSTKEETAILQQTEKLPITYSTQQKVVEKPLKEIKTFTGNTVFSNAALEMAEKLNADLSSFDGYDFVSSADVENIFSKNKKTSQDSSQSKKQRDNSAIQLPHNTISQPISKNKLREIEYLSAVQETGLTSTVYININTKNIYTHINPSMRYFKNSLLPIIIYETSRLLQKYKLLNSFYYDQQINFYQNINIGFAVDIDQGLKVVKIASSNNLSISEIETEVFKLSEKYIENKLLIEDLTDITFTITDLSNEGISFFKPLVNQFNSAILGISAVQSNHQQTLSLTFDHRVTEGKLASSFLNELRNNLESYAGKGDELIKSDVICYKCFKTLEDDISSLGFVSCITNQGKEGYICSSCWSGH